MIGIAQADKCDALLRGELHASIGTPQGVELARRTVTVVHLDRAKLTNTLWGGAEVNPACVNVTHEPRHTIDAMRRHSICRGFSVDPRANFGICPCHAGPKKRLQNGPVKFVKSNACQASSCRRALPEILRAEYSEGFLF